MASSKPLSEEVLDELLKIDAKSRELLCHLETCVVPLEVKSSATLPMEVEGMAESVDMVCDKVISTLKSVKAEYRKYCDLHLQPEKRKQAARSSNRQDSGFGSAILDASLETIDLGDSDQRQRDSSLTTCPIQEQGEISICPGHFGDETEKGTEV